MVKFGLKKKYFSNKLLFLIVFFALGTAFFVNKYLWAQNVTADLVSILNLAENQVLKQNYTLKFEVNENIEFVELHFIRLDSSTLETQRAIAKRESATSRFWSYDLAVDKLGNGNYRLETFAVFFDGTTVAGQIRNFSVVQDLLSSVNLQIINPQPEQILSGQVFFVAKSNIAVGEVIFFIYNNSGILVKQYISTNSNNSTSHQVEVNTNELGGDGRFKLVVEAINPNNTVSQQTIFFYIANKTDQVLSTTTLPIRISIITPINNEKLTGQVLLQAKVSESVDQVYFYLTGNYIPTRQYDNNLWQEYILTSNYASGEYDLLAVAKAKGKEYYSSIVKIFLTNFATSTELTAGNKIFKTNKASSTDIFLPNQTSQQVTNPLISTTTINTQPVLATSSSQRNDLVDFVSTTTYQKPNECPQNTKEITCLAYFQNKQNFVDNYCVTEALDINECNRKNEQCIHDGITSYELCERYLLEPRASRWCDLAEFKNQPLCIKYSEQRKSIISTNVNLNPFCIQQSIFDSEECQKFLDYVKLPSECKQVGIISKEKCQEFLSKQNITTACQLIGSKDYTACQQELIKNYQDKIYCIDSENCKDNLNLFVNELAAREVSVRVLEQFKNRFTSGFISDKNLQQSETQNLLSRLPVKLKVQSAYRLLPAQEAVVVTDDYLIKPLPALLIVDTDQDGLADDIEKRLGTDIYAKDTDSDGYDDLIEIKNGYDPKQKNEKWQKNLAPVEQAILTEAVFEHPKISGQESNDLQIDKIENNITEVKESSNLLLSGTGPAFSVLSLYIYSDIPLLATVQVDEFGHWQYALSDSLTNGEHQVYLVLNDEVGKIQKKSSAKLFFINEAKAVSASEYIDFTEVEDVNLLEKYYIQGTIVLILLAAVLFFLIRRIHNKSEDLLS